MPHIVEPSVYLIASTHIIPEAVEAWLESLSVDENAIKNLLNENKTHAQRLIEMAGRRCYMSFQPGLNPNVSKIRSDITSYLTNILVSQHGSVLEHMYFTFALERVSRIFTAEMNRHRAGMAISEGSMRYIRFTDIPYWIPNIFKFNITPSDKYWISKENLSRLEMQKAFEDAELHYTNLCEIWSNELSPESSFHRKKEVTSAIRRIIPLGVSTGGVWTGNIRALRHIFEMRCSEFAEEEILLVATMMLNLMRNAEPILLGDFTTSNLGFSKPKYSKV